MYNGLLTNINTGITVASMPDRTRVYGNNKRLVRAPKSYCELLWAALQDFTMKILVVASIVSIGIKVIVSIAIEVGTAEPDRRKTAWIGYH